MSNADDDGVRQRNAEIADNEQQRQVVGDVRVSTWAIGVAVLLGLMVFGWVLLGR